ncbi:hypothetical protein MRX96_046017 [Rhipicephalus microplus]
MSRHGSHRRCQARQKPRLPQARTLGSDLGTTRLRLASQAGKRRQQHRRWTPLQALGVQRQFRWLDRWLTRACYFIVVRRSPGAKRLRRELGGYPEPRRWKTGSHDSLPVAVWKRSPNMNVGVRQVGLIPAGCQTWHVNVASVSGHRFAYAATLAVYIYEVKYLPN